MSGNPKSAPTRVSHAKLVKRAGRWLRGRVGCPVVLLEASYVGTREVPDAIGFKGLARKPMFSVLVECKTTRQDFLKDKEKASRRKSPDGPSPGMGS